MTKSPTAHSPRLTAPRTPGEYLKRALFAAFIAEARSTPRQRTAVYRELFKDDEAVGPSLLNVTRAAVDPGTTDGWASHIVQTGMGDFLKSLGPSSAIAQIMAEGLTVPLANNESITLPIRQGGPVRRPWAGESEPISVMSDTLGNVTLDTPRKYAVILTLTRSLAKRSAARSVFNSILLEDAGRTLDSAYLSADAGSDVAHAGLLYGLSGLTPDTGAGREALREDLGNLAAAVAVGGSGTVVFLCSPDRAAKIPFIDPDLKARVLPTLALASSRVVAIDPAMLVHGFGSDPDIETSNSATVHMSDAPEQLSTPGTPATVAAPIRSLYQTDSVAVRLIGDIGFAKRRSNAVAFVDPTGW